MLRQVPDTCDRFIERGQVGQSYTTRRIGGESTKTSDDRDKVADGVVAKYSQSEVRSVFAPSLT